MSARFSSAFMLAILTAACLCHPALATELTDASGVRVRLNRTPTRIVTLAPSLGELAADLLGTHLERIVGVTEYTDYPPSLKRVQSVGRYDHFNLEQVVALKPDLALATLDGNSAEQVRRLRSLKIPVVVVGTSTMAQIEQSMRLVGQALGDPESGNQMADQLARGLKEIREQSEERLKKQAPKSVLLEVGDHPLVVAGGTNFLEEAIEAIGAKNIYAVTREHYPRPSMEDVIARNPDVILVLALGEDLRSYEQAAADWTHFKSMKSVQKNQVKVLRDDALLRPTPRLLEGLGLLERAIYGPR